MTGEVLVVIPARGGSKGVPGKNLARVGGVPLVVRAVRAVLRAPSVTRVVVSTDDEGIATAADRAGASVVRRPAELAGDEASSESAVLHALDQVDSDGTRVDVVAFVQCTSPFVAASAIEDAVGAVARGEADTALTAAPFHAFVWRADADGAAHGVNHDASGRLRRQDRAPEWLEDGAVYAMRAGGFREHRHRFFGRTALIESDLGRLLEIDEPADLERARALAPLLDADDRPRREDLDALVLDFDGTQTDDRVLIDADGGEQVSVHRGDGHGIAALRRSGLPVLILSTEVHPVVAARARKLGVGVIHGSTAKGEELARWCAEQRLDPARVAYVGNDTNDLPCLALVGWPIAVASAEPAVLAAARAVTTRPGGAGAIREIASWILGKDLS